MWKHSSLTSLPVLTKIHINSWWKTHEILKTNLSLLLLLSSSSCYYYHFYYQHCDAVTQWLRCCATIRKVAGSIPAGVNGIFHWHKILPIALWPWGRLSLQKKWVPGAFPGGKGSRCVSLPPSCAVMKFGNLNFLEPSGPLQACNGTDLPTLWTPCFTFIWLVWTWTSAGLFWSRYWKVGLHKRF